MSWTEFSRRLVAEPSRESLSLSEPFEKYIAKVNPRFQMYRHNKELCEVLTAVAKGEIPWLMVWIAPGTGKSELFSRLFTSYLLSQRPYHSVGVCSYGAMLAQGMVRDAREYFVEWGGELDRSQRAKTYWKTRQQGGMWGAGFGGAVRGFRYHAGLVDDPHKGPDDIESDVKRERLFRWWDNTWLNRAQLFTEFVIPRVVVMQRLADNDLCGHLLSRPDAGKWTVVALDAIRDEEEPILPESAIAAGVKLWPDWREHGDLLCPERLGLEKLEEQMADPDEFEGQYQQRPPSRAGRILDPSWFRTCRPEDVPPLSRRSLGVDLAVSKKTGNDFWAAFPGGMAENGDIYIFRPWHEQSESPKARQEVARLSKRHRVINVGVESVAFQLSFVHELQVMKEMHGFQVIPVDADRDKEARARGWSFLAMTGRIILVDDGSGWIERFLDEVKKFPRGKHDDQVDAVGILITMIRSFSHLGHAGALPHQPGSVHSQLDELKI